LYPGRAYNLYCWQLQSNGTYSGPTAGTLSSGANPMTPLQNYTGTCL
jgi:hypothetical protein